MKLTTSILALVVAGVSLGAGCLFTSADDCSKTLGFGSACGGTTSPSTSTGTSGKGGSGGTTGSGGDAGHTCGSAAECSVPPGPCQKLGTATCKGGACGVSYMPGEGSSEHYGSCTVVKCDATGMPSEEADPTNIQSDANVCTTDACSGGATQYTPVTGPCTVAFPGHCGTDPGSNRWTCVHCTSDPDCGGTLFCDGAVCVPSTCKNTVKDGGETDLNCGGPDCKKCGTDKSCVSASDCLSGVCTNSQCQQARCTDGVMNGDETDVDCGGGCGPCKDGRACIAPIDCVSGVCKPSASAPNACQVPSCTDGVMNGDETAVDCGGSVCLPCPP